MAHNPNHGSFQVDVDLILEDSDYKPHGDRIMVTGALREELDDFNLYGIIRTLKSPATGCAVVRLVGAKKNLIEFINSENFNNDAYIPLIEKYSIGISKPKKSLAKQAE